MNMMSVLLDPREHPLHYIGEVSALHAYMDASSTSHMSFAHWRGGLVEQDRMHRTIKDRAVDQGNGNIARHRQHSAIRDGVGHASEHGCVTRGLRLETRATPG